MLPYKVIDLRWSSIGDLAISPNGDIDDTSSHVLVSFLQEAKTRIQSSLYDWALQPEIGSNLQDLVGMPNNQRTAEYGKTLIINSLTQHAFCDANYIKVTYMPVGPAHLMYRIKIVLPDVTNSSILELNLLLQTDDFSLTFF